MPRKSAAALSVVRPSPDARPDEPPDLSAEELALWREVVNSKPADWFGSDSVPVLKEYIRAAMTCDTLAAAVNLALESRDLAEVVMADKLLLARDRESRRVANLATKLRLTQQSRYTPQAAATADRKASGARPWRKS